MPTGVVKWFNDTKGFGYIRQEGMMEDIMVHHTSITMKGFRTLKTGQQVEFEVKKDEKGWKATNVRPIDGAEEKA
jgi:CspA family cold shock protein